MATSEKEKKPTAKKRKAAKPKALKKNVSKETKETVKKINAKVRDHKRGKIKTIDEILQEQAKEFGMRGNEILSLEQIEMSLTQIALGNARDGLTGLRPTTSERMVAFKQLCDIKKNKVDEAAIDEHNDSIRELEFRNNYDEAPSRDIKDLM